MQTIHFKRVIMTGRRHDKYQEGVVQRYVSTLDAGDPF